MTLHHILLLLAATTLHFSDNRRLIDDLIDKLKSSQTKSISPSWEGIRRFDLIGTGKLPLQSHKVVTDYQGELLEDKREDDNRRVYSVDQADSLRRIPGQFSRNRNNPDSGLQRFPSDTASRQPVNYRYNQDPETKIRNNYDRFGLTWTDGAQRRNRRSASPYNRIKIKIANPFYFSNPKRRRLRLKKVVSAPAPSRQISGPQGFWEDNNFDRNFFDPDLSLYDYDEGEDLLQQVGGREPEPLSSDDMYQVERLSQWFR